MADQRTMAELLRAPTKGYVEEIVVPSILAEQFELKHNLINMMTSDQFIRLEKNNPHDHIRWFNKITSTIKYKDVPNSAIKLMLFPFSLAGAARRWLEKEPPHSILTWEDLVSKFINEFFPLSRTTNLRNEISNFQQRFDESFHEAWDRYKDLLYACPHYSFTELHQLDTFYNALNLADQNFLNSAVGGNMLERRTQDVLTIIENKSKVRNSRNKLVVSHAKSIDANSNSSSEIAKLTHAVNQQTSYVTTAKTSILKQIQATPRPAFVKAVEEIMLLVVVLIRSRSLPSNTIANPKGKLKAITTRSGIILDGPSVPIPPPFINAKEDERVEETLTDQDLAWYTIKVLPPLVQNQKFKPPPQRNSVVHQRNPLHPNIPYPSRMLKQKQQEKMKSKSTNFGKSVILKKSPEKHRDLGKFLISCGFNELKCKGLADLGVSINLMPIFVWKKLGLPDLISSRITLELANRAICTSAGIARDVFVLVGKFTFLANFVIVDYESDPRVPLILGRPFLLIARALIDVHGEEMILRDEVKDDVFDPDQVLRSRVPSPIPVEDSNSFLKKSDTTLFYSYIYLPEFEILSIIWKRRIGSTTTHADYSLPKYDSFLFEIKPDQGELTNVVRKDNLAELQVHVLTTYLTLMLDFDFIPSGNSLPEFETLYFDIEKKNSGSTNIHADISLLIIECFNFNDKPDPSELTSIVDSRICENIPSATNVNLPPFIYFLTYLVIPPNLFSFGNEETIFDPGIINYHSPALFPNVSHRCETFMKFNVYPKLLNESPMEILLSSCSPKEQ
nr:reverse transcriptase domain-containing protein [Tanacetum cinerariifolium]